MMSEPSPTGKLAPESSTPPKTSLLPLLGAGVFMLLGILALLYIGRDVSSLRNAPMPNIDVAPMLGTNLEPTNENLIGKIVVFHFWGPWQADSLTEYAEFSELYSNYTDATEVQFISVACDPSQTNDRKALQESTQEILNQLKISMPIFADYSMYTRAQIAKSMPAGGFEYPMTILVDQRGVVQDFWRGHSPGVIKKVAAKIEELRKQRPPAN